LAKSGALKVSHQLITHQNIGDEFSGTYYAQSAYIKQTVNKKDYTDMVLRDKSGSRPVKHWGTVKDLAKGCWVYVAAAVEEYQGNPSIIAKNIEIVDEPAALDDYVPVYDGCHELADDFDELRKTLDALCETLKDETCSMLVEQVYSSGSFFDRFVNCPGSDGPSYGKQGGLLASVVRVARHALDASPRYEVSDLEKAIMLTAALLYRTGAADAYEFEDCVPVKTKRGILLGMPNLTMHRIGSALRRVMAFAKQNSKEVSQETVIRVLHCIVAANNTCGIEPMTKEAMVLRGIIELDEDVVDALDFINSDTNKDDEFTAFDPRLRRQYYTG
jgi:23S rRNA maturation-related 3'-5' exoribonuclease YhaM